jgi:AcrR family transcriptional regulator
VKKTKGELTRDRIVIQATRSFARDGFAATSLPAIGRRVKLGHTAILHHFGDKVALFRACLEESLTLFARLTRERARPDHDARARLDEMLEVNLLMAREHTDAITLIISIYSMATFEPSLRALYTEMLRASRERYEGAVRSAVREGRLSATVDARLLGEILHEFIIGSVVNYLAAGRGTEPELARIRLKWRSLLAPHAR